MITATSITINHLWQCPDCDGINHEHHGLDQLHYVASAGKFVYLDKHYYCSYCDSVHEVSIYSGELG